jgi:hypothetical protein
MPIRQSAKKAGFPFLDAHLNEKSARGSTVALPAWLYNLGFTKQEIEIEESDIVLACLLRTHHIGFGTIGFQSV